MQCNAAERDFERRNNMPKRPHADTRLAQFISDRVKNLRHRTTQLEIASDAGFLNPNMISMLKSGATKLPLDRVPNLARALECDPAYLLRLTLEQVAGDTGAQAIIEILSTPVSSNELGWLQEIRDASDHNDPRITARSRSAIRAIFGK